jgi:hypothetical protein
MNHAKAAPLRTQRKWVPQHFRLIKGPNRCYSNADNLIKAKPQLRQVRGITRLGKGDGWGDHAWCITPHGHIIDPYFIHRFPKEWQDIEYRFDDEDVEEIFPA